MFGAICRNEWRSLRAGRAWIWAIALFAALAAYAAYTGSDWYAAREQAVNGEIAKRDRRRQEQLESLRKPAGLANTPAAAMPQGPRDTATLPPTPLGVLSVGQSDLQPFAANIGLFVSERAMFAPYDTQNPARLSNGRFDLAFVLTYLFPLLILAVTYNVISAEREQGTLTLTLAQPVTLQTLAFGKLLVRGVAVIVPVIAITLLVLIVANPTVIRQSPTMLLVTLAIGIAVYGLFWLALGGLVNAMRTGSAANALLLGAAWLGFVVVLPALLNLAIRLLYPLPEQPSITNQARAALVESEKNGAQVLGNLYQLHPELRPASVERGPISDATKQYYAVLQEGDRQVAGLADAFEQGIRQRQNFLNAFRFLSPAIVFRSALNDISGNGTSRFEHFRSETRAYQQRWRDTFAPRMFRSALLSAADYDWIPKFQYAEEPLGSQLARLLVNIAGIVISTALVLMLCQYLLLRRSAIL